MKTKGASYAGFIILLTLFFVVLRTVGRIDWDWVWVLTPLWATSALGTLTIVFAKTCDYLFGNRWPNDKHGVR